jgi:hypothetical protein
VVAGLGPNFARTLGTFKRRATRDSIRNQIEKHKDLSSVGANGIAPCSNRALINNALIIVVSDRDIKDMADRDPERFTLRQAAQARDDFAQIMDELDFVEAQLARLPTRRDRRLSP